MSAALSLPALSPAPSSRDSERQGTAIFLLSLRARGVFDTDVLRAMETVPRDLFAPRRFADLSRSDVALPLACGQTMTTPAIVAIMLAALDVRPGQRVLEIGTGSGYVTALLSRMGAEVRSLERHAVLAEGARLRLATTGLAGSAVIGTGDGFCESEGRYDRILLNGAVGRLDPVLTSRLCVGGRLVAGLAQEAGPLLVMVTRGEDGALALSQGAPIRISPLRER